MVLFVLIIFSQSVLLFGILVIYFLISCPVSLGFLSHFLHFLLRQLLVFPACLSHLFGSSSLLAVLLQRIIACSLCLQSRPCPQSDVCPHHYFCKFVAAMSALSFII